MRNYLSNLGLPEERHVAASHVSAGLSGSEFVKAGYEWYRSNYDTSAASQRGTSGKVFEGLILTALYQSGIYPAYYQATVTHVPHVVYDILLYHPRRPIILSCKVSLRERWKQADLEGSALRQVYRGTYSVLLTLSANEGKRVQRQIEDQDVLGLDECVVIEHRGDRFDDLLQRLQGMPFEYASPVIPVEGRIMESP